MKNILLTWTGTSSATPISSYVRRVYRWGTFVGSLHGTDWIVEQRQVLQEEPLIELCKKVDRAAPPARIDDAWEETVCEYGEYQSVEGSLLQICISSKEKIEVALSLGCPIDSSTLLAFWEVMEKDHEVPLDLPTPRIPPRVIPRVQSVSVSRVPPQRVPPQRVPPQRVPPQRVPPQRVPPQRVPPQRVPPQRVPPAPLSTPSS